MDCAGEIAEYKIGTDKPVLDRSREKAKISRAMALVKNHGYDKAVEELFMQLMSLSRRHQYSIIRKVDDYIQTNYKVVDELPIDDDTMVVYQGIPGAYQEEAMVKFFGEM